MTRTRVFILIVAASVLVASVVILGSVIPPAAPPVARALQFSKPPVMLDAAENPGPEHGPLFRRGLAPGTPVVQVWPVSSSPAT